MTFTGEREGTVIDYTMGDNKVKKRVKGMKIGDKVDSDHQLVKIWIKGDEERKRES